MECSGKAGVDRLGGECAVTVFPYRTVKALKYRKAVIEIFTSGGIGGNSMSGGIECFYVFRGGDSINAVRPRQECSTSRN